jgi:subfamily B ATP-binding cassette protein MsbA
VRILTFGKLDGKPEGGDEFCALLHWFLKFPLASSRFVGCTRPALTAITRRKMSKAKRELFPDSTDQLPPPQRPLRRFMRFVTPHWRLAVLTLLLGLIRTTAMLALPLIIKRITDEVIQPETQDFEAQQAALYSYLPWVVGLILISAVMQYMRGVLSGILTLRIITDVRTALTKHVLNLGMAFYERSRTGVVISRILDDANLAQTFVNSALTTLTIDILSAVIVLIMLFYLDPVMSLVILALVPLIIMNVFLFRKRVRAAGRVSQEQHAKMVGNMHERLGGYPLIVANGMERRENLRAFRVLRDYFTARTDLLKKSSAFHASLMILTQGAPFVLFGYGAWRIMNDAALGLQPPEAMTLGTLLAFLAYLAWLLGPLGRFAELNHTLNQALAGVERVMQLFDVEPKVKDHPNARPVPQPVRGALAFDDVTFSYQPDRPVLNDLSFSVEPGETVALVGPSGHGKSTILKLIARLYDPLKGTVSMDGNTIPELSLSQLRKHLGLMVQEDIVFSGSIAENMEYGAAKSIDTSEPALKKAAEQAHAWEFIRELPNQFNEEIGENGVKLSAGQRQRLALARLFLRNPSVLLLDEPTSALDAESEQYVQDALRHLMKGRTTLVVAHRLATVRHADRILVIKNGAVVEQGSHNELLKLGGVYTSLCEKQYFYETSQEKEPSVV